MVLQTSIAVFAHNEARGIAACLDSIYQGKVPRPFEVHVLANGCTDGTERSSRHMRATVPKCSCTRSDSATVERLELYVHGAAPGAAVHCFVDGDVRVAPGALPRLPPRSRTRRRPWPQLLRCPPPVATSRHSSARCRESHALAGNLYALSADFVARVRAARVRLRSD